MGIGAESSSRDFRRGLRLNNMSESKRRNDFGSIPEVALPPLHEVHIYQLSTVTNTGKMNGIIPDRINQTDSDWLTGRFIHDNRLAWAARLATPIISDPNLLHLSARLSRWGAVLAHIENVLSFAILSPAPSAFPSCIMQRAQQCIDGAWACLNWHRFCSTSSNNRFQQQQVPGGLASLCHLQEQQQEHGLPTCSVMAATHCGR